MRRQRLFGWLSTRLLIWLAAIALLGWVLRRVPLAEIWTVLGALRLWQIAVLTLLNAGIVLLFGARWWLILRALGYRIPYIALTRYRLAAFGVSYFTPGPHFGGEPLQVHLLGERHGVPGTTATAAIVLDKSIELLANFSFLIFGLGLVLASGGFLGYAREEALFAALALLGLPAAYLTVVWMGGKPLSWVVSRMPASWRGRNWMARLQDALSESEDQVSQLCKERPGVLGQALVVSGLVWLALIFEYSLALRFLGLGLNFGEVISIMTAARIALLTPLPGALGALEAGQVLAMEALGLAPAFGLSIGLLIRARDVVFGAFGLWWGWLSLR